MPENILPQTPAQPPIESKPKHKVAVVSILLTIVLTIVLVILGERIMWDINRFLNPAGDLYGPSSRSAIEEQLVPTAHAESLVTKPSPMIVDGGLETDLILIDRYTRKDYQTYRLLLHTAVVVPIFLLTFLFYYFLKFKRESSPYQIISWSYLIFAFWMVLHLLGELGFYMIRHYKTLGIYLVLGILVAIFTVLIVVIQKKLHAHALAKGDQN